MGAKPLEWIANTIFLAGGGADTRDEVDLNLDDDEVAEIHLIESEISFTLPATIVTDAVTAQQMLSMDPSAAIANPYAAATYEDLETLYTHRLDYTIDAHDTAASVDQFIRETYEKQLSFVGGIPILVATNLAHIAIADAGIAINYFSKVWFTRKKIGKDDLTRILLKRR